MTDLQLALFPETPNIEIKLVKQKRTAKPRQIVRRVLHLGAGVQSSALAEMVVEGDLPRVDLVIFADTGNEPHWVHDQLKYLRGRLASVNTPLAVVKKEGAGLVHDSMYASGRFASMPFYILDPETGKVSIMRRQCTNEYKIYPSKNYLLNWLVDDDYGYIDAIGRRRVKPGYCIESWYGISAEESHRAGKKRGAAWDQDVYPLINKQMRRSDCVKYLLKKGLPVPKKSSCKVCPYHSDEYWYDLFVTEPDEFESVCVFDDWLRTPAATKRFKRLRGILFLHPSAKPLRSIDFQARLTRPLDQFKAELIVGSTCSTDGGFSCHS